MMSANNWRQCPKCLKKESSDKEELLDRIDKAYGRVPKEKYNELVESAKKPTRIKATFREDYQIGLNDRDRFIIGYRGRCDECEFKYEFNIDKFVLLSSTRFSQRDSLK